MSCWLEKIGTWVLAVSALVSGRAPAGAVVSVDAGFALPVADFGASPTLSVSNSLAGPAA